MPLTVRAGLLDIIEAEVEGVVSSFDGDVFTIDIVIGGFKASLEVPEGNVERDTGTWELPSHGDKVTVKLR